MVRKSKSKTKSSKKVSKRKTSKKSAKRKSTRRNPESYLSILAKEYEKYYTGKLNEAKLRDLKDEAYDIDRLYRTGKRAEYFKEAERFEKKNGKLGSILLESAQADSCPYAAKC